MSRSPLVSRRRPVVTALAIACLAVSACTAEEGETSDGQTSDDADTEVDGGADGEPALPGVTTVDPDEAGGSALDTAVASSAEDAPDGWETTVVPDPRYGPYVLTLPADAVVWRIGDDLDALESATDGTAWWEYWAEVLDEARDQVELSTLRAAVVLPEAVEDEDAHLTLNLAQVAEDQLDDPAALAQGFADGPQGEFTVEDVGTAQAGDLEVGTVVLTTPDDEFADGIPRRLEQWFYPEAPVELLWSVTCEAPAPSGFVGAELCDEVLGSFRVPAR
jgi:hypothetical protein